MVEIMNKNYIFNSKAISGIAKRLVKRCKSGEFNFEVTKNNGDGFEITDKPLTINKNTVFFSIISGEAKHYCFSNGNNIYVIKVLNYKEAIENAKNRKDYKRIDTSIKLKLNVPRKRY